MHRTPIALLVLVALQALCLVAVGVWSWQTSRRVAALEVVVASGLHAPADAPGVPRRADAVAVEEAMAAWRDARAGVDGALSEDEAAALIESTVEEALERKRTEHETAQVDQYMKMAEDSMRVEVEDLGADLGLPRATVDQVVEVLVQGMYEGHQLREDLKAGTLSMREAKEEGERIKKDYERTLRELLGDEAYEELGRKFYGELGWAAAR